MLFPRLANILKFPRLCWIHVLLFRRPTLAVLSQVCVGARGTPLAIRVYPLHSSSDSSACLLWRPCFKPTFAPLSRTWSFATPFVPEPLHLTAPHGDEAFFICLSGEDDNWAVAHSRAGLLHLSLSKPQLQRCGPRLALRASSFVYGSESGMVTHAPQRTQPACD